MLILSRKVGEKIKIGEDVYVTVLNIKGGRVKIGVSAPETTKVLREEVAERPGEGKPK